MASKLDSWARFPFEPGARVELHPYRDKRCFPECAEYDGEFGTVLARVKDGKVRVRLDKRLPDRRNDPEVPMMALRPVEG